MKELHLTKKDFVVQWYSGSGAGGQYRNKHQNCCRIIHKASGLRAQGTEASDRPTNQRVAFNRLARLLLSAMENPTKRRQNAEVIRNYHAERNEVLDKASGLRIPYRDVVTKGNLGPCIDARRKAMLDEQTMEAATNGAV